MTAPRSCGEQLVTLRPVQLEDAAFIAALRASVSAKIGLNVGAVTESEQREWLLAYIERQRQGLEHYFIIVLRSVAVGAVRIYKIDRPSGVFTWGSWVMQKGTDPSAAWLSAIAVYDYAFDVLGLSVARFEVVAQNVNVVRFHRGFGAHVVGQTDTLIEFAFTKENYCEIRGKFLSRIGATA